MSFSSIKNEDGSSIFSLGKRSVESFDDITFNEQCSSRKVYKQNTMTTSTKTKKCKIPIKKSKTQENKNKKCLKQKKRQSRAKTLDNSNPYTFEKIQPTPNQFYNRFEQLLNQNTRMNNGLGFDVDGLERNLSKLQNISKGKSSRDQNSNWLTSLNPIKKVNSGIINFDEIARKMTEQHSSKESVNYSSLDTADGMLRSKNYLSAGVDCQLNYFACNDYNKKYDNTKQDHRSKNTKRNILEEISSFNESIDKDDDAMSDVSEDDRNYGTLKNMLTDMKDFIGNYSHNNSTHIPEDYENSNYSMLINNKVYDDMHMDDFSMKAFKPNYVGVEESDLLGKELGQCYDSLNFF